MGWLQRLVVVVLLACVVGRVLWPDSVSLDGSVLFLMSLAVVIVLAPVLLEAEFPGGTRFKFREKLDEAEDAEAAVERRVIEAAPSVDLALLRPWHRQPGLIIVDDDLRSLASAQPTAAIGVIRTDLRRALIALPARLSPGRLVPLELDDALGVLEESGRLWPEQMALIRVLLDVVDQALLSGDADETDANRIIGLVDTINLSFPIGYSPNFAPNEDWEDQGLICEYEHCIEHMPLPDVPRSERLAWKSNIESSIAEGRYDDDPARKAMLARMTSEPIPEDAPEEVDRRAACPIFGHFCPGGEEHVRGCGAANEWTSEVHSRGTDSVETVEVAESGEQVPNPEGTLPTR